MEEDRFRIEEEGLVSVTRVGLLLMVWCANGDTVVLKRISKLQSAVSHDGGLYDILVVLQTLSDRNQAPSP